MLSCIARALWLIYHDACSGLAETSPPLVVHSSAHSEAGLTSIAGGLLIGTSGWVQPETRSSVARGSIESGTSVPAPTMSSASSSQANLDPESTTRKILGPLQVSQELAAAERATLGMSSGALQGLHLVQPLSHEEQRDEVSLFTVAVARVFERVSSTGDSIRPDEFTSVSVAAPSDPIVDNDTTGRPGDAGTILPPPSEDSAPVNPQPSRFVFVAGNNSSSVSTSVLAAVAPALNVASPNITALSPMEFQFTPQLLSLQPLHDAPPQDVWYEGSEASPMPSELLPPQIRPPASSLVIGAPVVRDVVSQWSLLWRLRAEITRGYQQLFPRPTVFSTRRSRYRSKSPSCSPSPQLSVQGSPASPKKRRLTRKQIKDVSNEAFPTLEEYLTTKNANGKRPASAIGLGIVVSDEEDDGEVVEPPQKKPRLTEMLGDVGNYFGAFFARR